MHEGGVAANAGAQRWLDNQREFHLRQGASPLGGAAYAAAKFGLRGLAMALAAEEKDNGVRVASIYPGEVDTPILANRPTPLSEVHRQTILQPEDVAAAIVFIATLPPRVAIPELVITPAAAVYL